MNTADRALDLYENGSYNYRLICMYANDLSKADMKGFHVHHVDGNHKNNHPDNLLKCTPEKHAEFHKNEGLSNWISLQHYAAVKGGKIGGKLQDTSKQMKKVWANYSKEEKEARINKMLSASNSPEKNKSRTEKLTGFKRPDRTEEHTLNWKKSRSIGLWCFGETKCLTSVDLSKKIEVNDTTLRIWCNNNHKKIGIRTIKAYPFIFNNEDLGKTFKNKGFCLLKKPIGGINE